MNIQSVLLRIIEMPLKKPFKTHLGTVQIRESIIIEVHDRNGCSGFGEVVAFSTPWYTEETIQTAYHILKDFLIPMILQCKIKHPKEVQSLFSNIRRNNMAKAGIETAIWDLYAKSQHQSLSEVIGGTRKQVLSGVVVGTPSITDALQQIEDFVLQGYKRVKVKIDPTNDYLFLSEIRRHYPELWLMADANSAYTLKDAEQLIALDDFGLQMIEQPLAVDDIVDHAQLQKMLKTPICLDESITSYDDARRAIQLGSCKMLNIKIGRVGGLLTAKNIHDFALQQNIQVWCGGMIEFGISRAHNIALASLPGFTIPNDISGSERYWEEDIISPEVIVHQGEISVPTEKGIGYFINLKRLKEVTNISELIKA